MPTNGFFQMYVDVPRQPELSMLGENVQPAAPMLCHVATHDAAVSTPAAQSTVELEAAVAYGCHGSALKEALFVHSKVAKQVGGGHVVVLEWCCVRWHAGLCIGLVSIIPQEGHRLWLCYDCTWNGLNHKEHAAGGRPVQEGG